MGANGASYAGVQTCGSVWLCPVCSAKIRQERADELDTAARRHVGLRPLYGPLREDEAREWGQEPGAVVGGLEFLTLTIRHARSDALVDTLDAVAKGWQYVQRHRRWRALRKRLGHEFVRALEITITREGGWHPHLHVLLFTLRPWSADERADAEGTLWEIWRDYCDTLDVQHRHRPSRKHGLVWEAVKVSGAHSTARYLSKMCDDGREWGPAQELARGDLKHGRHESRNPYAVGLSAAETGDERDLARWREYEDATFRRRFLTPSRGWRKLCGLDQELDDDELAARPEDGYTVGYLLRDDFRAVRSTGCLLPMLQAVEREGLDGFWRVLHHARAAAARRGLYAHPARLDELRRW